MKTIYKNIALAALALSAVACSQEDDFSPSYLSDPDAVHITAQVGTDDVTGGFTRSNPIGTAEAQAKFNAGDQIAVNGVTYEKGETSWNPVGDAYLKWETNEMTFTAYYPVGKNNASTTTFTVPTEYTEANPIADADYMTYSGSQTKGDDNAINLTMQRKMVRIVVDEISFNDQFATGYSVTAIKVHANTTGYADGATVAGDIQVSALQQDGVFYALLAPTTAADNATFLTVTVSDGTTSQDLTVKGIPATVAGNSYNYSLTVGKDYVGIGNVTVTDWKTGKITGGVAEEVTPNTFDATAMTAEQLNSAVTAALEHGHTDITVTLAENAEATMFIAIRRALIDTESVADGSINLTLAGVTTIPDHSEFRQEGSPIFGSVITDENGDPLDHPEEVLELNSVSLPDVTVIGMQAFLTCENLTSINAPKAHTIGDGAFGSTALTSVEFPELTTIPGFLFSGTWTLTSAKFPKVTTVEMGGLLIGGLFNPESFPLELTAEGDITFKGDKHFNVSSQNYSDKVDLVLHSNKRDEVTYNADNAPVWNGYTFKSITFKQ